MSTFKIEGLDKLQKQFKKMEQAAEELERQKEVPFSELFTSSFMRKYTSFSSFNELLEAGGFHAETKEEFEAIPDGPFDVHIASTTKFKTWKDMINKAAEQYTVKKLGL